MKFGFSDSFLKNTQSLVLEGADAALEDETALRCVLERYGVRSVSSLLSLFPDRFFQVQCRIVMYSIVIPYLRRLSMRLTAIAGFVGLLILIGGSTQAGTINASTSATNWDAAPLLDELDDIELSLTGLDQRINSDLDITFRLRADLDGFDEFVTLSIDGIDFGNWLNEDLADDVIADIVNDDGGPIGNQSRVIFEGTTSITQSQAASILADGLLVATFDFSDDVNDVADPPLNGFEFAEFAEFSVSYSVVPEPSSMMLALSAGGLTLVRRRRRS